MVQGVEADTNRRRVSGRTVIVGFDVNGDQSELDVCMPLVFRGREYSTSYDFPGCVRAFIIYTQFEECSLLRLQDVNLSIRFSVKPQNLKILLFKIVTEQASVVVTLRTCHADVSISKLNRHIYYLSFLLAFLCVFGRISGHIYCHLNLQKLGTYKHHPTVCDCVAKHYKGKTYVLIRNPIFWQRFTALSVDLSKFLVQVISVSFTQKTERIFLPNIGKFQPVYMVSHITRWHI